MVRNRRFTVGACNADAKQAFTRFVTESTCNCAQLHGQIWIDDNRNVKRPGDLTFSADRVRTTPKGLIDEIVTIEIATLESKEQISRCYCARIDANSIHFYGIDVSAVE
tara:strand:- start:235 stop:561 length:327 start_codon:yes stop_codon:yes gene_type:complete